MDSEDEMAAALKAANEAGSFTGHPSESTGNSESGEYVSNFPGSESKKPSTMQYDMFEMVAHLLNQLERIGENLIAYSDAETGETELSGESHTLKYDDDSALWVIVPGRSASKSEVA